MAKITILVFVAVVMLTTALVTRDEDKTSYSNNDVVSSEENTELVSKTRHKRFLFLFLFIFCAAGAICNNGYKGDQTPPEIQCPPLLNRYIASEGSRTVQITWPPATANDNDEVKRVEQNHGKPPGSMFEAGKHILVFVAEDKTGNMASCHVIFYVDVITCPFPTYPDNGKVVCPSIPPIYGDVCKFTCNEGYETNGMTEQKCLKTRQLAGRGQLRCTALSCDPPQEPANAKPLSLQTSCTDGFKYRSVCVFECKEGYSLAPGGKRFIQCQGDQTWDHVPADCVKDISPPEFWYCPTSFSAYVDRSQVYATVIYDMPRANDSSGNPADVKIIEGVENGTQVAIDRNNYGNNDHTVTFTAVDQYNVQATIPCTFSIHVKEILCPQLRIKEKLIIDCTEPLIYGAKCQFSCTSGYPRIGPAEASCEKTDDQQPMGYWDWGGQNETYCGVSDCPPLDPPLNGAMSCITISIGQYCTMSCNENFDIPRTGPIGGTFVCDDAVGWLQDTNVPDCSEIRQSNNMNLPTEFFYFSGDCTSNATQEQLRLSVIRNLNESAFQSRCTLHQDCTVDNVEVTCGPISGRRKRSATHIAIVRFDFVIKINYTEGWDAEIMYREIEEQSNAMFDTFQNEVKSGLMDIEGFDVDVNSVANAGPKLECDAGMKPKYDTFSCVGCPTGMMYNKDNSDCEQCPKGTYQDQDSQKTCKPCPEGFSTATEGAKYQENCTRACKAGHYSVTGVEPCIPCDSNTYQDKIGMTYCESCPNGTNTTTQGATHVQNCTAEGHPACLTKPCNDHGVCYPVGKSFKCVCTDGYGGETCTIPPDPCVNNLCQNGATCESVGDNYTCECTEGYTGHFCHLETVNGGWSNYSSWSECSTTCDLGVQSRSRECNSPPPKYGGKPCEGDSTETQSCLVEQCPYCKELERPYGVYLSCSPKDFYLECNLVCTPGSVLSDFYPTTLRCGNNTGYEWDPNIPLDGLPKCTETQTALNSTITTQFEYHIPDEVTTNDENDIHTSVESLTQTSDCVQQQNCNASTQVTTVRSSAKRDADSVVIVRVVSFSDIQYESYFQDGEFDNDTATKVVENYIAALQGLEKLAMELKNATENGRLDVRINNQSYVPLNDSFSLSAKQDCPPGMFQNSGFCANCPPGTKSVSGVCEECPIATYQEEEGQLQCLDCPLYHTTQKIGAAKMSNCIHTVTEETKMITSTVATENSTWKDVHIALLVIGAFIAVVIICVSIVAIVKRSGKGKQRTYEVKQQKALTSVTTDKADQ